MPPAATFAAPAAAFNATHLTWPAGLPVYDHVVIVVEENKDYEQIFEAPNSPQVAPYFQQLKSVGASLTQMFAEEHHSEGNYFWLFSGSNQDVGFIDQIPSAMFSTHNLGERLVASGRTFKGYSEDLPVIGSKINGAGLYARKHVPWASFSNLPTGTTATTSANLRFKDFPADYSTLPTVSFVIPNLVNDMHDGSTASAITAGDKWLRKHFDGPNGYLAWATQNNSLLIITFDENDHGPSGLTDPAAADWKKRNRIVTILAGAHVKPGYEESQRVTHVNLLRTLEAMYGLEKSGAQQTLAKNAGISDDAILKDVFEPGP
ncbi:MAG: alkaline phosphatase family protein [Acidobacteriota bacterium]